MLAALLLGAVPAHGASKPLYIKQEGHVLVRGANLVAAVYFAPESVELMCRSESQGTLSINAAPKDRATLNGPVREVACEGALVGLSGTLNRVELTDTGHLTALGKWMLTMPPEGKCVYELRALHGTFPIPSAFTGDHISGVAKLKSGTCRSREPVHGNAYLDRELSALEATF